MVVWDVLRMDQLTGCKVYKPRDEKHQHKKDGTLRKPIKLGKVHAVVFSPSGDRFVGLMVARPDVAGMVKREDLFVGYDSFATNDFGLEITRGDDSFDDAARKRLHLDWDACIIWGGMDVRTKGGRELGYVADIAFDAGTGKVETIYVTDGSVSTALVGALEVSMAQVKGYHDGYMVVDDSVSDQQLAGGLAGKAGEGYANAKVQAKEAGTKAGAAASDALDKGSFALGQALGKAKRAVDEVKEARDDEVSQREYDENGAPTTPLTDVRVEKVNEVPAAGKTTASAAASTTSQKKVTYAPAKPGSKASATKAVETKRPTGDDMARAVGQQLGRTKGMFAAFKKEFDENSK
jgi:uncharacterized protein YrrD/Sec-independent protein translocase protein TatA